MGNKSNVPSAQQTTSSAQSSPVQSSCPVLSDAVVSTVYNELAKPRREDSNEETLSQRNAMPIGLRNKPMAGQQKPLSTDRVRSTIPKGQTEDTWTYPSPQMFFNGVIILATSHQGYVRAALKRKGKGEDVVEDDMDSVVYAHNTLNEITWRRVLQWERLHCETCPEPKLLKFCGRPDALSPKARFYSLFGDGPFDRHDWTIDRCGTPVRYVIDFYFSEDKAGQPEAFQVDARPALDSWQAANDRVRMSVYKVCAKLGVPCPITGHTSEKIQE